ncbi:MAG: CidA/LrgA family protein [Gammaproteobacteria bacterium]|nr:CidA/LrgA family protein [Gammaproteobacteria bacterium]MCW8924167.1 CidA/LrgA family protein [Gammaproteobacteria bacterium]
MNFLPGISLLLIYQLAGELCVKLLDIPVPGPVVGMLMLFLTLVIRGQSGKALDSSSGALLSHLSLLFVPAGVGIMVHFDRIVNEWQAISIALILSTIITIVMTALIMLGVNQLLSGKGQNDA